MKIREKEQIELLKNLRDASNKLDELLRVANSRDIQKLQAIGIILRSIIIKIDYAEIEKEESC